MSIIYQNPIIPGFYPDPSICRVNQDYYLVTSTFEYFPGLPIFHSRDLVHWRQIGHVLDRPSQLHLDGIRPSGGLYAPTIRFHDGKYFVINTLVDGLEKQGNFIVTATNPAGPWSEPFWLDDAPGIDPSLFFDDDGRVWYCGNRRRECMSYEGDTEIWLQELDINTIQLIGSKVPIWRGALRKAQWPEAPHIYKFNDYYYLLIAEGGTGHNHAVTIARANQISGPYQPNPRNPILTHRHLGLEYPIVGTGHADLVETHNGEWWMVCLAMRPYDGYYYNLGRETFLVPVIWEDGWPVVASGIGKVQFEGSGPDLPDHKFQLKQACDQFDQSSLDYAWNFLRTPREKFWSLSERPGFLRLNLRPETLMEKANPSFIGRRQQHINFVAATVMEFSPSSPNESAGLVLLQRDTHQIRCVVTMDDMGRTIVKLVRREDGRDEILSQSEIRGMRIYLKVEAHGQAYRFYITNQPGCWRPLGNSVDGRILSTPIAGGFTGAYLGMYASSNGSPSQNYADFDWFEVTPL